MPRARIPDRPVNLKVEAISDTEIHYNMLDWDLKLVKCIETTGREFIGLYSTVGGRMFELIAVSGGGRIGGHLNLPSGTGYYATILYMLADLLDRVTFTDQRNNWPKTRIFESKN